MSIHCIVMYHNIVYSDHLFDINLKYNLLKGPERESEQEKEGSSVSQKGHQLLPGNRNESLILGKLHNLETGSEGMTCPLSKKYTRELVPLSYLRFILSFREIPSSEGDLSFREWEFLFPFPFYDIV